MEKKKKINPWVAKPNQYVMCPVPGCQHFGNIITKAHCRIAHKLTRDEVKETYGVPSEVKMKMGRNKGE